MSGPHIELTSEQQELVSRLCEWYRNSDQQTFSYTGAAGTGKTTVIRAFIEELHIKKYVACAFVGKAVTVLSRQGLPASTIHSLIYNVGWIPVKDEDGNPVLKEDGTPKMKVEFALKSHINGHPQLIIVDEATMVNDDLAEDILSFGIKTVFILYYMASVINTAKTVHTAAGTADNEIRRKNYRWRLGGIIHTDSRKHQE